MLERGWKSGTLMEHKLYLIDLLDLAGKAIMLVSVVGSLLGLLYLAGRLVGMVGYLNLWGL